MDPAESASLIRASKRAEWFWLAAIAVAVILTAHAIYTEGWENRKSMLLIPGIAALWYGFRRNFRKRLEKQQA
jgi:hypothetical protein